MPVEALTLITPTGDRPQGFARVERWLARQTWTGRTQWIVVDDGLTPTQVTAGQQYIRRSRETDRVGQTLNLNLRTALPHVQHDHVLVVEDDDWYPPNYLADMAELLDGPEDLVGIGMTRKYHLASQRWHVDPNKEHAGLFTTGFKGKGLDVVRSLVESADENDFLDLDLWDAEVIRRVVVVDPRPVAIKGMRERPGISMGHDFCSWFAADTGRAVLRQWLGEEAEAYSPWVGIEAAVCVGEMTSMELFAPLAKYGRVTQRTLGARLDVDVKPPSVTVRYPAALSSPVLWVVQELVYAVAQAGPGRVMVRCHDRRSYAPRRSGRRRALDGQCSQAAPRCRAGRYRQRGSSVWLDSAQRFRPAYRLRSGDPRTVT